MDKGDILVLRVLPLAPFGCAMVGRGGVLAASSALNTLSVQSLSLSGLQGAVAHKGLHTVPLTGAFSLFPGTCPVLLFQRDPVN